MALKKPSDFFGNNKTPLDKVKESYDSARPEKIEQISEAFDVFKSNLNHIQSLSDFTSTLDSFKNNLEKVESVSGEVSEIKEEIKSLIKKEDLDSAMMAQLLFVEESITNIESKILSINGNTVDKIKEDFVDLSNSVGSFLNIDAPKYKKLISESEIRSDDRLDVFKGQVKENLNTIKVDVSKEVTTALESIESVNENTINIVKAEFKETVRDVNKNVSELVEKELPKYNKLFAETEVRTEEKINEVIDSYKKNIEDLNAKVKLFTETEVPKYSNLLIETKLKSEKEVKDLEEEVLSKVNALSEKVQFISEGIPEKTSEKIQELKDVADQYKEEIDSISKKYQSLYKDFKKREVSENEKLENYSQDIEKYHKRFDFLAETVTEDIVEIQNVLVASNENYHASLKTEVVKFRNKISEQMKGLEMDLTVNEKHIKKQNDNIEGIREEIKGVFDKLQLDLFTEVINWEEMKDFQLAMFKSGVPHIDIPQDMAFIGVLYKFARKYNIPYILNGGNISTECVQRPLDIIYWGSDMRHINDILNKFGTLEMKTFPFSSAFYHKLYLRYFRNIRVIKPLNYINYIKKDAMQLMSDLYDWKPYPQKHFESRFTRFFEGYWLPTRFGFDMRRVDLSSLILTNQISREEALEELNKPTYDSELIEQDFYYIAKKLNIDSDDLKKMHEMPKKYWNDYKNLNNIFKISEKILQFLSGTRRGGSF